ncbi:Hypothetical protein SMAX5B_000172 [Scophthalmus maximus]|uniref:Uncharacterized protein n=1 Tax=Scophthalmus maximus TaxID=52904 RepID=A0A2U9CWG3_SCOMX|nr:Hypothetical protein SMAX5B_000172 [Scophthalmus maximus]
MGEVVPGELTDVSTCARQSPLSIRAQLVSNFYNHLGDTLSGEDQRVVECGKTEANVPMAEECEEQAAET